MSFSYIQNIISKTYERTLINITFCGDEAWPRRNRLDFGGNADFYSFVDPVSCFRILHH